MAMHELEDAMEVIREASDTEQVILGLAYDDSLEDELRVTVIATGFDPQTRSSRQTSRAKRHCELWKSSWDVISLSVDRETRVQGSSGQAGYNQKRTRFFYTGLGTAAIGSTFTFRQRSQT